MEVVQTTSVVKEFAFARMNASPSRKLGLKKLKTFLKSKLKMKRNLEKKVEQKKNASGDAVEGGAEAEDEGNPENVVEDGAEDQGNPETAIEEEVEDERSPENKAKANPNALEVEVEDQGNQDIYIDHDSVFSFWGESHFTHPNGIKFWGSV